MLKCAQSDMSMRSCTTQHGKRRRTLLGKHNSTRRLTAPNTHRDRRYSDHARTTMPRDPPRKKTLFPLEEKTLPRTTLKKKLLRPSRAPARVPPWWVGVSWHVVWWWSGRSQKKVRAVRGGQNFEFFFLSRPSFLPIPEVFRGIAVVSAHLSSLKMSSFGVLWTSCEAPAARLKWKGVQGWGSRASRLRN